MVENLVSNDIPSGVLDGLPNNANYINLHMFPNGLELWEALAALPADGDLEKYLPLIALLPPTIYAFPC